MAILKLAICQINIELKDYPFKLAHPQKHRKKVMECLNIARQRDAKVIIFPEYNLNLPIIRELKALSAGLTIFGGSYISSKRTNRTVVAIDQSTVSYDKINLSPYEPRVVGSPIVPGAGKFLFLTINNISMGVLTCFDYFREVRRIAMTKMPNIEVIFCSALNNNNRKFLAETESLHNHVPEKYSIYCNAARLWVDGVEDTDVDGGSYVFGPHDVINRQQIIDDNWALEDMQQNILFLEDGEKIGFIDIEIPYHRTARSAINYTPNPTNVNVIDL